MLQPRLSRPLLAVEPSLSSLAACLNALSFCPRHARLSPQSTTNFVRHASHQTQGRANGPGDSAGRRLGAKKSASEYVIPGNIIFKQRGTKWHPGENTDIGKDHTIYATVAGYVRYYKNPALHPKRRYIGVALKREGPHSTLPTPHNAPTRRRLGMYATPIQSANKDETAAFLQHHLSENSKGGDIEAGTSNTEPTPKPSNTTTTKPTPVLNRHGNYRESNYEIGRTAEKKGVRVREYERGDRWLAWRKRTKRVKMAAVARASKATRKTKGKKVNKGVVGGTRAPRKSKK